MISPQALKKRISGIKSVKQITSAMELVAATKMRRAQETALNSRGYAFSALELLANLYESLAAERNDTETAFSPLLEKRPVKKTLILLAAADKGLAGSFNGAVFKKLEQFMAKDAAPAIFVAVGQKSVEYIKRRQFPLEAQFTKYGDIFNYDGIIPLANILIDGYEKKKWDRVIVFSTHFLSALKQEVVMRELLPVDVKKIRETVEELVPETGRFSQLRRSLIENRPAHPAEYLIEPSRESVLRELLPLLLKMQVYHIILEANASEHSARRVAMKNATDNAGELIHDLTLQYNRSRQAIITKEITEIVGAASALQK